VHPLTGEVKDGKLANTDATPSYWPVEVGYRELLSSRLLPESSTTLISSIRGIATTMTTGTAATSSAFADRSTATSTPDASPTTVTSTFEPSSSGLSAGVSAGIGVGCGLLVVGLIAVGWLCRRSRKRRRVSQPQSYHQSQWSGRPFIYGHVKPAPLQELNSAKPRNELESPPLKQMHNL